MINFKDAIPPAGKGNVRKIDGTEQTVEYPDGWQNGTALNRANLMAMQGFGGVETVFNADGSISETFTAGTQVMNKTTSFNDDGSITEGIQ